MPDLSGANAIYLEIKTRSVCDRRKVDPCDYAGNWSTDVRVVGYAIGDSDGALWHPGDPVPPQLTQAIASGSPLISYDAPFHRALFIAIMGPRYGWPVPLLEQWICMAAMGAAMGLPDGLDEAATAMGVAEANDKEARNFMRRMAGPRSKTKSRCVACGMMGCEHPEMFNTTLTWWCAPEDLAHLDSHCIQDVRTGRALFSTLRPLSEAQRANWLRLQAANERDFLLLVSELAEGVGGGRATTPNAKLEGVPEIVARCIRGHVQLIHILAAPLTGQGKIIATAFGEDPDEIDPKTGKNGRAVWPKVIQAEIGDVRATLEGLAQVVNRPHYNVYMPLAIFRPDIDPRSKGSEGDVVACLGIVADFDDPNAGSWAERLPIPPNYVIQSSAGRYQAIYLFDKPEPPELVKPVAKRLKIFASCDHGTSDISHVWRVPGALNWPNAKKVAEGRSRDPQLVRVEVFSDSRTSLQALSEALPQSEAKSEQEGAPISRKSTKAHPHGNGGSGAPGGKTHSRHRAAIAGTPENLNAIAAMQSLSLELQDEIKRPVPRGHRSEAIFKVIAKMIEKGLDDKTIENIIHAHPEGIGEKHANRGDLEKEIARVRKKTAASAQGDANPQGDASAHGDLITTLVSEMNRKYAVVDDHGKTVVVYRKEDADLNRKYVVRATYQDFRNMYLNTRVQVPGAVPNRPKTITHAELWLKHHQRKTIRAAFGSFRAPMTGRVTSTISGPDGV